MKTLRWLIGAVLVSSSAVAQESGLYAGGALGEATVRNYCESFSFYLSCNDRGDTWKLFAGYQFGRHFSLEAAWTDMEAGKATLNELNKFQVAQGITRRDTRRESEAAEIVAIGWLPVGNRFRIYGKFGLYRGEVVEHDRSCCNEEIRETKRDLTYGIGAHFDLTQRFGVRAEWQNYQELGPSSRSGFSDVRLVSAGLLARF